jgi:uncharacterized phage protein (TIGR01671 family)
MREIKFRAWHMKQNRMYSAEELGRDQMTLMPDGRGFANISGCSTSLSQIDNGRTMIPEQFTGLKDSKNVDIYEGDIVKRGDSCGEVYYHVERAAFVVDGVYGERQPDKALPLRRNTEVIGNIHQNADLVK